MNAAHIAAALGERAEAVCRRYLPQGRKQGRYWVAGDLEGAPLFVRLHGPGIPGKWTGRRHRRARRPARSHPASFGRTDAPRGARRGPRLPRPAGSAGNGRRQGLRRNGSGPPPLATLPRHPRHPCRGLVWGF